MDSAQRDAVLRMLIPALGVVIVYMFAFSEHKQLTATTAALEGARAAAIPQTAILPVREELNLENEKQAQLEKEKLAMDERWTRLTALRSVSAAQRATALRQLTRMLWDRGLVPFEESPDSGTTGQLPGSFDDVIKRISTTSSTSPRLWRVRFYGRYRDVADTLASLGDSDVALVPVGLTMSEAHPDTDWRMWTLLLWN